MENRPGPVKNSTRNTPRKSDANSLIAKLSAAWKIKTATDKLISNGISAILVSNPKITNKAHITSANAEK